jgi:hypothetical protein
MPDSAARSYIMYKIRQRFFEKFLPFFHISVLSVFHGIQTDYLLPVQIIAYAPGQIKYIAKICRAISDRTKNRPSSNDC